MSKLTKNALTRSGDYSDELQLQINNMIHRPLDGGDVFVRSGSSDSCTSGEC